MPLLAFVAMLTVAAPAFAGVDPCVEYPDDPECTGDVGPTGGTNSGGGTLGETDTGFNFPFGVGPSGQVGGGTGGTLPFTGYPVSPLIIFALLLLLLGICVRLALAAGRKARERYAAATPRL